MSKTEGRKLLEELYDKDDCMRNCALCLDEPRPSLAEPFCADCRKQVQKLSK